jgi:hypothetical protein
VIIFGTCVGNQEKYEKIALPSIERAAAPGDQILTRTGESGICKAYNEFIEVARRAPDCSALVLIHQDAEILDGDFKIKVAKAFSDPGVGVLGVIGGRGLCDLAWWRARHRIGMVYENNQELRMGKRHGDVDVLDGLLLVVSPTAVRSLSFDAQNFPAFHGYGVDYCLQARNSGLRVVVTDIDVNHRATRRERPDRGAANLAIAQKWPRYIKKRSLVFRATRRAVRAGKRRASWVATSFASRGTR